MLQIPVARVVQCGQTYHHRRKCSRLDFPILREQLPIVLMRCEIEGGGVLRQTVLTK
jgi:hypothetical protein